eukprot:c14731_g1_i1.p1 GENE.c14731_g1_i1~~c14731_g1_i1.p1  ORF type:complete len:155 (+),score=27.49 c14731_g1_i1:1-465(+)
MVMMRDWNHWILFVAHHCLCISYMTSTWVLGRGALSAMVLMFFGEWTSPLQNIWYITGELARVEGKQIHKTMFSWVRPVYVFAFSFARFILAPIVASYIAWYFTLRPQASLSPIPLWLRVAWSVVGFLVPVGSWSFAWQNLSEYRNEKQAKKKK